MSSNLPSCSQFNEIICQLIPTSSLVFKALNTIVDQAFQTLKSLYCKCVCVQEGGWQWSRFPGANLIFLAIQINKTLFICLKVFLSFFTFSIISIASLTCKSFFRVSDSTHSQAVHSATYMQFKAVITSVILSPKEHTVQCLSKSGVCVWSNFFLSSHSLKS